MSGGPLRPFPITDPDQVGSALAGADERDRRIIELRYGLAGRRRHSRAEIARLLDISPERVRQLESRAIDRLDARADADAGAGRAATVSSRGARAPAPSRHTLLRSWILVLLRLRPAHVYELRGRLRELGLPAPTYRLLQALEEQGFLRSSWAPGRGAGPDRRVYDLTSQGIDQLRADVPALVRMVDTLQPVLKDEELTPSSPGSDAQAPASGQA